MPKITIEDLKRIKDKHKAEFSLREGGNRAKVTVHMGTCGIAAGAREVMTALTDAIAAAGVTDVIVTNSGCAGACSKEPMATVEVHGQAPVKYVFLSPGKIKRIFDEHIQGGKVVEEYALAIGSESTY
jgi:NADP-reducing hydrogenase subunit HndB